MQLLPAFPMLIALSSISRINSNKLCISTCLTRKILHNDSAESLRKEKKSDPLLPLMTAIFAFWLIHCHLGSFSKTETNEITKERKIPTDISIQKDAILSANFSKNISTEPQLLIWLQCIMAENLSLLKGDRCVFYQGNVMKTLRKLQQVWVLILFSPSALKCVHFAHKPQLSFSLYHSSSVLVLNYWVLLQCYLRCRQAGWDPFG